MLYDFAKFLNAPNFSTLNVGSDPLGGLLGGLLGESPVAYTERPPFFEGGESPQPFQISLVTSSDEPPTYEITVGRGYVCERIPSAPDAIAYHEAENMYEAVDPPTDPETFTDTLRRFPITVGQAIYIRVEVNADGIIDAPADLPPEIEGGDPIPQPAVSIVVGADEQGSTHYIPKVGDVTPNGAAGYYLYKLAVLKAPDGLDPLDIPSIQGWLTGSHIDHYQELPAMESTLVGGEGIGVVPKEWSEAAKAYKFRVISQKDPVAGDSEADPPVPAKEVQIHVEQDANRIIVKGNGKGRVIQYQIGSDSPVMVATFDDGLETSGSPEGNEITIPIPAAGGGGLPNGDSDGDMLYWDATNEEWILLPAPAAPDSDQEWVMHHSGTEPSWNLYNKITVSICESGTPTEYTILGIPTA